MAKLPYMQFFVADYLSDPCLSVCSPATRGIWIDILCNMHKLDRTGELSGTRESLARLTRCSLKELDVALRELLASKTADVVTQKMLHCNANVTPCNDVVTVKNRRMEREYKERIGSTLRVKRHRVKRQCNNPVTPYLQNHSIDSEIESKEKCKRNLPAKQRIFFPETLKKNQSFMKTWDKWIQHWQEKYSPLTTGQQENHIEELLRIAKCKGIEQAVNALKNSINVAKTPKIFEPFEKFDKFENNDDEMPQLDKDMAELLRLSRGGK
jgi:uncharacterized protein YdaU (DUF1376 family)